MQGEWKEIQAPTWFTKEKKTFPAMAFYRRSTLQNARRVDPSSTQAIYMADFVYIPETSQIIKNRHGSVEMLYENAERYMRLRHNPNESVRRLIEKAETLAALIEKTI